MSYWRVSVCSNSETCIFFGRFHSLEQFDERKRSCRKRLDGHNRRRRKPQPEPHTRPGSFLSNYQGKLSGCSCCCCSTSTLSEWTHVHICVDFMQVLARDTYRIGTRVSQKSKKFHVETMHLAK